MAFHTEENQFFSQSLRDLILSVASVAGEISSFKYVQLRLLAEQLFCRHSITYFVWWLNLVIQTSTIVI